MSATQHSSFSMPQSQSSARNRKNSLQMAPTSTYLGRSYVGSFISPAVESRSINNAGPNNQFNDSFKSPYSSEGSKAIHESGNLHKQTAFLSDAFDNEAGNNPEAGLSGEQSDDFGPEDVNDIDLIMEDNRDATDADLIAFDDSVLKGSDDIGHYSSSFHDLEDASLMEASYSNENLGLLPSNSHNSVAIEYGTFDEENQGTTHYFSLLPDGSGVNPGNSQDFRSHTSHYDKARDLMVKIAGYSPAVGLGLLLNILDALSYGMIIFPITEPLFSHLGPTGLSMFYVSTVICQLCFSLGLSSFPSAIGSEMIEITPFFHTMAISIMNSIPAGNDERVITTTIVCYAMSSVITGLTFFFLGKMRLGKIVGFFPRHILIGCIGGVGYFLVITGMEVCTRVSEFQYSWPFLSSLFTDTDLLFRWLTPAVLTLILVAVQSKIHSSLVLPTFYIITLLLFHFVVAVVPSLSLDKLRDSGWIFAKVDAKENWYDFYTLYNFKNVEWSAIPKQVPTMLALTFFGILHVPINVPALAMSLNVDKYNIDKELIAHGYSNLISGLLGSIQNYLVYTNSVLFIRAGADSPIAGIMLTVATFIVMVIGPVIISFIPICIVGSLIFLLGYELIQEAIIDPFGKLQPFEYLTILIIVITMGAVDFVIGIIVGILLACFSFLVTSTQLQTINGEYDGKIAKSTVYRDYIQSKFLRNVGEQIYVLKLQNILFFGTIISIEEKVNSLLEICDSDTSKKRIKYLILDFKNIRAKSIDYSAAEGFNRIKRFLEKEKIDLIISSIDQEDQIYIAFDKVGLLGNVELFSDLNGALEWCENEFLLRYKRIRTKTRARKLAQLKKSQNRMSKPPINTPRNHQFVSEVRNIFSEEMEIQKLSSDVKERQQFLPVLLMSIRKFRNAIQSTDETKRKNELDLWKRLIPYFEQKKFPPKTEIRHRSNMFIIVESGALNITHHLVQGEFYETMSPKTAYGIINNVSNDPLAVSITTDTECVIRYIDINSLTALRSKDPELYAELLILIMSIHKERFRELLGYSLISM
ncbi:unnamed protein product [Kluyveromyces dobzhanskii CBS 2104]|uniref:WGS project CCBQ000000000 data, contig 00106 n=1 Tax=Kluyveromyces dobzhanskii CBS 2104 TaxID=1427455 RepID=A0A0A8L802_9SACH|nr:unnamed protein product [Kluyveromyces dobzhanskii CBS 2104]